jgi:hypothetical protein
VALSDLQTALGRLVRVSAGGNPFRGLRLDAGEREWLAGLVGSAGLRFTVDVQRSWCAGRAAAAAKLTLSILPVNEGRRLVAEWVEAGGGTASFFAAEADAFLDFIAQRLPDPSHALTLCRVEQATLRAREGMRQFTAPDPSSLNAPGCTLRAGRYATLVRFYAEPRLLLAALRGQPLPPVSRETAAVLVGPALNELSRFATREEVMLWERVAAPEALSVLLGEGHRREVIETLVAAGIVESTGDPPERNANPRARPDGPGT